MRLTRILVALVAAGAVGVAIAGSTGAKAPESPEELVFRSWRAGQPDLYLIGRDGLGFRRLTFSEALERTPRISPDGRWIAFSSNAADGNFDIWVMRRDGDELTRVTSHPKNEANPAWLPDGRIVFLRGELNCAACSEVVAVRRGGGRETTLPIEPVSAGGIDVSPDGTKLAYARGSSLYTANADGTGETQLTAPPAGSHDIFPSFSPGGNRLAFIRAVDGNRDLAVMNLDGTGLTLLTATPGRHEEYPSWSQAGDKILFMTYGDNNGRLRQISPDGTDEQLVSTDIKAPWAYAFATDGRDASLWHEIVTGTGVTVQQVNGRLEIGFSADATQGGPFDNIEGHFGSHCSLPGDFDLQVDYEVVDWPEANGTTATLDAFFGNASVGRESQTWGEQYTTWLDGTGGWATTEENSGSVRLVRGGGKFQAFWRYQGVWVPLRSGPANSNATLFGMSLRSFNNQFAHQPVKVAFDDFRLNSGAVECPEWWQDALFGDFG